MSFICPPPRQQKPEALSAHFYQYINDLRLLAYLKNINTNLDASSELDDFIDSTLFASQYCRLVCEDRKSRSPNVLVQFSQNRIVGTLNRLQANFIDEFDTKPRRSHGNNRVQRGKNLLPRFKRTQRPIRHNAKISKPSTFSTTPKGKPSKLNLIAMDPDQPLLNLEEPPGLTDFEPFNK